MISEVTFNEDHMDRIPNLDKTNVSYDGNDGRRVGIPPAVYIMKGVPWTGTAT